MSRSTDCEIKTRLSEEVHKDKKGMKRSKVLMITCWILFGLSAIGIGLVVLIMENKIPSSLGGIGAILILIFAIMVAGASLGWGIAGTVGFCRFRHDYNWDLDAMEDGYKYLEDALGWDEEAEDELEIRRAKRETKMKKRG